MMTCLIHSPRNRRQRQLLGLMNLTCLFFPMPATMSLIRRLSSRAKKSTGEQLRKLSSLTHRQSSSESIAEDDECCCALPEDLLFRIVDLCVADAPLDVFRWRAVSRAFRNHVDRDVFGALTELDAKKDDLEAIVGAEECWQKPSGAHIAIRVSAPKVEIIVDRCWTSKDVAAACGAMNAFRHNVQKVTIDAPISELIVVSLSMIDLSRWYAFQCFMKAVNDHEMHLARGQVSSAATPSASEYWPFVTHLAIRTTEKDSNHLARIIDYGVRSQFVINRRVLQDLRVVLTDVASSTQCLQRNLYHFRCWAGSAGFDDRFSQQYGVVAIQ